MNHLMRREDPSPDQPGSVPSQRAGQQAATRHRIVAAVADLVTEEHPATISVPAVARRAGVSVATVYRYFPNKEELLDAGAEIGSEKTMADFAGQVVTDDTIDELIARSFGELADHLPLVRNQQQSPAGRELRKRRRAMKRGLLIGAVRDRGLDPDDPATQRLLVLIELLASSNALLELHDQIEVPVDEAAAVVTWAVRALLDATELDLARRSPSEHTVPEEGP